MNGVLPARIALIPELLERAAADWPDRTALVCGERRIDSPLRGRGARGGATLRQALPPGARVATLLGNSDLACVLTLALQMAGCQHVPLNPLYTARELDFILRDAQPAADRRRGLVRPGRALAAAQGIRLLDGAAARAWTIPSDETPAAGRRRGRAGAAAIHRRHHRPAQGRHPEPGRHRHQCVPARSRAAHAPRRRDGALRHAAVPFLRHGDGAVPGGQRRRHAGGAAALPARRCSTPWRASASRCSPAARRSMPA